MEFLQALPVWPCGRHDAMNLTIGFRCVVTVTNDDPPVVLHLAMRSLYRLWLDGRFCGYGPARSAHGHVRVDAWTWNLPAGPHLIAVEAVSVNVPAFATLHEHPFVQAEVLLGSRIVVATGASGWLALVPGERIQRMPRMSRQRGFSEAWRLHPGSADWRSRIDAEFQPVEIETVRPAQLQPRQLPLPTLPEARPIAMTSGGTAESTPEGSLAKWETWMRSDSGTTFAGFPRREWEVDVSGELASWICRRDVAIVPAAPDMPQDLTAGTWRIWDFGVNQPGCARVQVVCTQAATVYVLGDEVSDAQGDVDPRRLECFNGARFELAPGTYDLITFEILTLRFLKVLVLAGAVRITAPSLMIYARDLPDSRFSSSDPSLERIFVAAVRTFAHNTVDNYLDCPSRERAGWLCDSFFIGRAEPWLTGSSVGETVFLENYSLCPVLPDIPKGMLPKLYPGDQSMGWPKPGHIANYLPTWPMWLVLQIEEFAERGGDRSLVAAFLPRFIDLFALLDRYLNAEGLLERLDGWIFVDWSDANQHVQAVNFPVNMLYAAALDAAGRIYRRADWCDRAADLRQCVRELAWDGRFFGDNAERGSEGRLVLTGRHTEACQYYAFIFGVVSPSSHPELWQELVQRCSLAPGVTHPELPRSGVFIGQHLRMLLLARHGETARLAAEIIAAYLPMAERTGTLWEYEHPTHSCDHGFAGHVAHLLITAVFGLTVDRPRRRFVLRVPVHNLAWIKVRLPWEGDWLELGWERTSSGVQPRVDRVPLGWTCNLET